MLISCASNSGHRLFVNTTCGQMTLTIWPLRTSLSSLPYYTELYHSVKSCCPRLSDPGFDKDCLEATRITRHHERAYLAACRKSVIQASTAASTTVGILAAKVAWYTPRRIYRKVRQSKCSAFWCSTSESDRFT